VERRFKVNVQLEEALSDCKFTSNFDEGTSVEEVFSSMEKILPVSVVKNAAGEYRISGSSCK
jgi:hypothetical protein